MSRNKRVIQNYLGEEKMTKCIREGNFGCEAHICFQCGDQFFPGKMKTCKICNWKKCEKGHCGCTVSKETKEALDKFYVLFCDHRYSRETEKALDIMLKCYLVNCHDKR